MQEDIASEFLNILRIALPQQSEEYFDEVHDQMLSNSGNESESKSFDVTEFLYPYL